MGVDPGSGSRADRIGLKVWWVLYVKKEWKLYDPNRAAVVKVAL